MSDWRLKKQTISQSDAGSKSIRDGRQSTAVRDYGLRLSISPHVNEKRDTSERDEHTCKAYFHASKLHKGTNNVA